MARPRYQIVNVDQTPYYHVTSRCVRRAFLCGLDRETGKSFEHRRGWLERRIRLLSSIFAIDICAYAIMSNHYHIVVRLAPERASHWSPSDVLMRWLCLFKGTILVRRYSRGERISKAELETVKSTLNVYQSRLQSLSWFMKCLNEPIARMANAEDQCSGHFWEARFSSPALTSEKALLACMAYVDLNPVRAGESDTPEHSSYTSIKERLSPSFSLSDTIRRQPETSPLKDCRVPITPLVRFQDQPAITLQPFPAVLPFTFRNYLELLDWSGRSIRDDKRGHISARMPSILQRLSITHRQWTNYLYEFDKLHRQEKLGRKQVTQDFPPESPPDSAINNKP